MTTTLAPPTTDTEPPAPSPATALVVALGSALLAAVVLLASSGARPDDELDWSHFLLGLAATVALLGFALFASLARDDRRVDLMAWPAALGAIASGVMAGTLMGDHGAVGYVVGAVIVLIALVGFLAVRRPALVLAGLAGVALLYVQAYSDVVGEASDSDNFGLVFGAGVTVFVVLATLVCWRLPGRELTTIVIGGAGVAAQAFILFFIMMFALFGGALMFSEEDMSGNSSYGMTDDPCAELDPYRNGFPTEAPGTDPSDFPDPDSPEVKAYDECIQEHFSDQFSEDQYDPDEGGLFGSGFGDKKNPFENDVWWILGFSVVQCLLWAGLHRLSGHVGYRVLILASVVVTIPIALQALFIEDQTWWEVGLGVAGVLVLGYAAWSARLRPASPAPTT